MQRLIGALPPNSLPPLSGRILRYLDEGVVEREGSVLLKALGAGIPFDAERHQDLSRYECAVNHLRFDAPPLAPDRALATALTCAGQLAEMLERSGCAGPFRVIVAEEAGGSGCSVRFHRLRAEEGAPAADIESDPDVAVLVLDCGTLQE